MSKRPRDEASIASLKSILGDLPDDVLENLLYRANNNLETAINLYFTEPQPPQQSLESLSLSNKDTLHRPARYFIGEVVVTAWSLLKGISPLKEGQQVEIVRDKVAGKNAHRIVRFAANGREIGRLPKDTASYISVLLDQQLCQFEGSVVWSPKILSIGEDIILSIKCYLMPVALSTTSFRSNAIPAAKKKSTVKGSDDTPIFRKVALLQMFKQLGLRPVRSAIQRMNVDGGGTVDMLLQAFLTKEEPVKANEQEDDDEEEDDEAKEISDKQLDTIYEKAQIFDAQIKPMDTPATMALELKEYQKRALAWMHTKEMGEYDDSDTNMRAMHPLWEEYRFPGEFIDEHRYFYFNPYNGDLSLEFPESSTSERGGILADEMGLGKTIEVLSLIHTNRCKDFKAEGGEKSRFRSPTTLVVCPMSLIAQWRDELIRGSKPGTLKVALYYGDDRSNTLSHLCRWDGTAPDVLITTYGVLLSEWNKPPQDRVVNKSELFTIDFWRVVIDEAHQIKNRLSKLSQACNEVKSCRRWALTGTPIQNKLDDLYSLVRYLHHEPWANHTFWRTFITIPFEKKDPRALSAVQTVLEPIILRRTKAMKDSAGRPMVPLPPKTVNIEYLSFSKEEQDFYDSFYEDSKTQFSYFCEAGKIGQNYASIFQLLTRLRQICCHPYLVFPNLDIIKEKSKEKLTVKGLLAQKSAESSGTTSSEGDSSYSLSVLQSMLAIEESGFTGTSQETKETDTEPAPIAQECPICFETVESMISTPCMHFACRPCAMDYFQRKEDKGVEVTCFVCSNPISQAQLLEFTQQKTPDSEDDNQLSITSSQSKAAGKIRFEVQKAVGGFKASTKLNALLKHLRQYIKQGLKTVVFSQFTTFLDLIEVTLTRESMNYTRLDGTQTQSQREKVLRDFSKSESGADILLISLKAGGVGLNLTCASRIIMMDPWWNFAIEAQAIDRVHRLGQLQEVIVTRFIMRDSVEERILAIQDRKHMLTNELYMSKAESKNRKMEELQLLFSKKL